MSWLNNSLNTIKGQLTNLAQEVLADTAGPGDEEYRGSELNTKTALDLLTETQLQKEQLDKVCDAKDREIAALRKQINTLKSREISEGDGCGKVDVSATTQQQQQQQQQQSQQQHNEAKSSSGAEDQNVEDSWCWEPAGSDAAGGAGAAKGGKESGLVDITLDSGPDVSKLNAVIADLEEQNAELRNSLDELDAQHELAMQDVLAHKTQMQSQLTELKKIQADRLVEHELAMARLQSHLTEQQDRERSSTQARKELEERVAEQEKELQRNVVDLADMQQLLDKRGADNGELIERVRQAEGEREKLQRELDELAKLVKEKKTSESSNSSSTGKQSEDEFIVVRNADAGGSSSDPDPDHDATTPPSKEKLRDKLVSLETQITNLITANQKYQDAEVERQLANSVLTEQLSELETRLRISESEKEQLQLELQRKLQQLMLQNQELKLNAEADQETHANDLEQQLGELRAENRQLRQELDSSIAQAKFRQAIAEEKQEITDLDLDLDDTHGNDNDPHKLRSLLEALIGDRSEHALERTYRLLNERWQRLDSTEQRLVDLQDQQLIAEHEKKTLEADISQYILQCDELMKNNELLLNELDKFKRNKLETIEEHHEETIAQLEAQLEEAQSQLQRQQQTPPAPTGNTQSDELMAQLTDQLQKLESAKAMQQEQLRSQLDQMTTQLESKAQQLEQLYNQQLAQVEQLKQLQLQLETKSEQLVASTQNGESLRLQLEQVKDELQQLQERTKKDQQLEARDLQLRELSNQVQVQRLELDESKQHVEQLESEQMELLEQLKSLTEKLPELHAQLEQQAEELRAQREQSKQLQVELQQKEQQLLEQLEDSKQSTKLNEDLQTQLEQLQQQQQASAEHNSQVEQLSQLSQQLTAKQEEFLQLQEQQSQLQQTIDTLTNEKLELIKALQQKHAENTQYYAEIQRLLPLEQQLAEQHKEREKLCDQISFLKEKSDILTTNLLTEQTNQRLLHQQQAESQEQHATVQRDLERLRAHLLEIEELHTQESVELQRELEESRTKQAALQQEVSKSSTAYTSASIRANQQAETLQAQHALLLQQRDELLAKLGVYEDRELKQQAALTNLQCALEQFQNDKQHDIDLATQRMRREVQLQEHKQAALQAEMGALQQQLADANQGLRAATRLSDQLEAGQQTIAVLRDEVDSLKDVKLKLEQKLSSSESSQTDKIDKSLIKSLLIGYVVSGHAGDKQQVLRMISSVLDFNAQESDRVGLNKTQGSWLGSILGGGHAAGSSVTSAGNENLMSAFVQFLEKESQPQAAPQSRPTLLSMAKQPEGPSSSAAPSAGSQSSAASTAATAAGSVATVAATATATTGVSGDATTTPPPPPTSQMQTLLMSNNEFAPTRNSSSILKDILSDT